MNPIHILLKKILHTVFTYYNILIVINLICGGNIIQSSLTLFFNYRIYLLKISWALLQNCNIYRFESYSLIYQEFNLLLLKKIVFYLLIYLFLAVLGLHCCLLAFSVVVSRLLIVVSSLVSEHRL